MKQKAKVRAERGNSMAPWIIGYGTFLVILFSVCTVTIGLATTMWGFVLTFAGCTAAAFALWWRDEYQRKQTLSAQESISINVASLSHSVTMAPMPEPTSASNTDWLSLEADDFDLLETYTQDLTKRVEAVYPLVERDHVHKIVWTVMIELFCKRMATASHPTPASLIAAKMARAA
jgi:hypothetical protein